MLRPKTGAQQREGDNVVWSVFRLSPVEEGMLHCPGFTLCMRLRLCAESTLNKGSF